MPTGARLDEIDTPALLIDLDIVERNVAEMAAVARDAGVALRPHTKTHKSPEIAGMQVGAGATGLTVAKLGEAEVMADAGFADLRPFACHSTPSRSPRASAAWACNAVPTSRCSPRSTRGCIAWAALPASLPPSSRLRSRASPVSR